MLGLWNLRQLNLFDGVPPAEMEQIIDIIHIRHCRQGEIVFRPGDPCNKFYLLHHGRIKTYTHSERGQEKIMHIFHPGDAFGGLLFGTRHGELPWAKALDDVVLSFMGEPEFKRFIQTFPDLCMNIFRYIADHHASDMRRLEYFIHTEASHRLVYTLLELGQHLGYNEANQFEIAPAYTHEDLANMIGVVRSTVSEIIGQLRSEGILGGQGRHIIVNRLEAERYLVEVS